MVKITEPFKPSIAGVGYLGSIDNDGKSFTSCKSYYIWNGMIRRCYGKVKSKRDHVYDDCEVCEEWHNYQNFKRWYKENYYEVEGQKMNLDKDILVKGNKIYSPSTCVFVPREINTLFIQSDRIRGNLPVGVHYNKKERRYKAQYKKHNKVIYLGRFIDASEAFYTYKEHKEKYIKELAEMYKNVIPQELYEAIIRYEIEITD